MLGLKEMRTESDGRGYLHQPQTLKVAEERKIFRRWIGFPLGTMPCVAQPRPANKAQVPFRQIFLRQRGFNSPGQEKTWPNRTVADSPPSQANSFGPGASTATPSRAAPRRTTRSPAQAHKNQPTGEPSPGLLPLLRCFHPSPEALPAPLPMPVASVAALRTAGGSGRCRGAGSPQVGLNGGSLPSPRHLLTLLWLSPKTDPLGPAIGRGQVLDDAEEGAGDQGRDRARRLLLDGHLVPRLRQRLRSRYLTLARRLNIRDALKSEV